MKAVSYIALLCGLALATALIALAGTETVVRSLAAVGWNVAWIALYFILPLSMVALGWRQLFAPGRAPSMAMTLRSVWIGIAVNWLLPVAQVGGELVRARLIIRAGMPGADAGASVVVDKTVQAVNVVLFGLLGLVLLISLTGEADMLPVAVAFLGVLAVLIFTFYRVQRAGMFGYLANRLPAFAGRTRWEQLVGGAEALDEAIRAIYRAPRRVVLAAAFRMAGRLLLTGELWLALHFLGHPISFAEALMLESLGQAIRGGMFFVPGALGVQEGSFMVMAPLVGLSPEIGLALSLVKRSRELIVGVPALVYWQASEGRWLWQKRRALR